MNTELLSVLILTIIVITAIRLILSNPTKSAHKQMFEKSRQSEQNRLHLEIDNKRDSKSHYTN